MSIPRPILSASDIGSGHLSPEAIMQFEQFARVGNDSDGEAYQRISKTNEKLEVRTSGNYTYVGYARPNTLTSEAKWKIKRIDSTVGVEVLWADGDALYNNIFDNYLTLSYS